MAEFKTLSDRISCKDHGTYTTLVISPRNDRKKDTLLTTWVLAWTVCGLIVFAQLFLDYTKEEKLFFFIFLSFWLYYEYRVSYVWLWRKKGMELLKIEEGKITYKRSIKKYGKSYSFFIDNIKNFGKVEKKEGFFKQLEQSYWVIGGERLAFDYQGRQVKFGIQLSDQETEKLAKFLRSAFQRELKTD